MGTERSAECEPVAECSPRGRSPSSEAETGASKVDTARKRLLIFVNPRSGPGKGLSIYKNHLLPRLTANGIEHELIVTEYADHAKSIVKSSDRLHEFNAVVILSGDGLVFEVLNGIIERQDFPSLIDRLPVGIVPSGSGNGLLSSVFHQRRIPLRKHEFLRRAIENVCSLEANAYPVNLMHVETPNRRYVAFLAIGYGLIADIDIESERWRKSLGSARFAVGGVLRLLNLRSYRCKLSYLQSMETTTDETNIFPKPFKVYTEDRRNVATTYAEQPSPPSCSPSTLNNDTLCSSSERLSNYHLAQNVPQLTDEVPSHWHRIEDEFLLIYAVTVSHVSQDAHYMPKAKLTDRNIYLSYILKRDVSSKIGLFKFLADMQQGKHVDCSFFHIVPVESFRLEIGEKPVQGGFVTVDGEAVDCNLLQATVTSLTTSVIAD